ncbi:MULTISPECIES: phosphotransferase [Idiomarina]|uniref:aminoglycoside phosphotransferase family protein n=1 Tax=Idiomarina TaxID=135575 RepID=UPI000C430FD1|nr:MULTISPECIES: phosphotransferase [Idiomarina]MAO68243.1 serine/threonine protein kinase [Idiomarina sp.]MBF81424.1 serine/threonine protein kinase [Idiomarina sp.]
MEDKREVALQAWCEAQTGVPQPTLEVVSGDASFRRYFRATNGKESLIAVDCPPEKEPMEPFLAVAQAYADAGVTVPEIIAADTEQGFMLQSDFGQILLLSKLHPRNARQYYQQALAALPNIMSVRSTELGELPAFDTALLKRELSLFKDWLLQTHLNLNWNNEDQEIWQQFSQQLIDNALEQPQVGVHRDYHSRNLMLLDDDSIGVIDFQDAVLGPVTYDAVSLLRDCYIEWLDEWVAELGEGLRQQLVESNHLAAQIEPEQWQHWFDWMGLQRHTKAAGIFARLAHRDHKPGYLQDVPRTLGYLQRVSANYSQLSDYNQWLEKRVIPAWKEAK